MPARQSMGALAARNEIQGRRHPDSRSKPRRDSAVHRSGPVAARKFVIGLRAKLKTLAAIPKRCPAAPEDGLDGMEIRHLILGNCRVIFVIDGGRVVVLQVRHGARLPMAEK
jgi:plasmid stabilization system protein ParE